VVTPQNASIDQPSLPHIIYNDQPLEISHDSRNRADQQEDFDERDDPGKVGGYDWMNGGCFNFVDSRDEKTRCRDEDTSAN
jgi:hypothetical protein